jgi:hypothetical protein
LRLTTRVVLASPSVPWEAMRWQNSRDERRPQNGLSRTRPPLPVFARLFEGCTALRGGCDDSDARARGGDVGLWGEDDGSACTVPEGAATSAADAEVAVMSETKGGGGIAGISSTACVDANVGTRTVDVGGPADRVNAIPRMARMAAANATTPTISPVRGRGR